MKIGCLQIVAVTWSLVAVILKLANVGAFAGWDITAWPWHWSCLCILYWTAVFEITLILAVEILHILKYIRQERITNSYAPEQRAFIRRIMNGKDD